VGLPFPTKTAGSLGGYCHNMCTRANPATVLPGSAWDGKRRAGTPAVPGGATPPEDRQPTSIISSGRGAALLHALWLCLLLPLFARAAEPTHQTNVIEGWTVLVDIRLLKDEPEDTAKALGLLRIQLQEIVRVVPSPAVARLREIPLWFSPPYASSRSGAEYHPDAGWLRSNQRNPAMARGVEFSGVKDFEAETRRMPNFTLHELAHGYHDRVLEGGFDHAGIKALYEKAKASGIYDRVQRQDSEGRRRIDRAYALSSPMEYFAESTEAYFTRNDFFPFHRSELHQADPAMEALLGRLWGVPPQSR